MNYIDINQAAEATGKSAKTIRRLLSNEVSKAFIEKRDGKIFVEVNYLFASYPFIKGVSIPEDKGLDTGRNLSMDNELSQLKNKIALYEQEIKHKDLLLTEKEGRIGDLQKALLLISPPAEDFKKKKKWWWI